jgi:hypothetical protein
MASSDMDLIVVGLIDGASAYQTMTTAGFGQMESMLVSSPSNAGDPVTPASLGLLDRPVKPGDDTERVGD